MRYRIRRHADGSYGVERKRSWWRWRRVGYVQQLPGLEDMWMPHLYETEAAARAGVDDMISRAAQEEFLRGRAGVVWEAGY